MRRLLNPRPFLAVKNSQFVKPLTRCKIVEQELVDPLLVDSEGPLLLLEVLLLCDLLLSCLLDEPVYKVRMQ